jgi:hypothetical protein
MGEAARLFRSSTVRRSESRLHGARPDFDTLSQTPICNLLSFKRIDETMRAVSYSIVCKRTLGCELPLFTI